MKNSDNHKYCFIHNLDSNTSDVKRDTDELFDMVNDDSFKIRIARVEVTKTQGISLSMKRRIAFSSK